MMLLVNNSERQTRDAYMQSVLQSPSRAEKQQKDKSNRRDKMRRAAEDQTGRLQASNQNQQITLTDIIIIHEQNWIWSEFSHKPDTTEVWRK